MLWDALKNELEVITLLEEAMGLDSAFLKQTYIFAYDRNDVECSINVVVAGKKVDIDPNRLASVRETIIEMRHCWMIHDWLEKKLNIKIVGDIYLHIDDLKNLKQDIRTVLNDHSKAAELIPDEDYEEYYFEWLQDIYDEFDRLDLTWKPYVSYVCTES